MSVADVIPPGSYQYSPLAKILDVSRKGIVVASVMSDVGFLAAKGCTQLGFSVARHLTTSAITSTSTFTERTLFGSRLGTDKVLNGGISRIFDLAQSMTLAPIALTQTMADYSILAASSSVEIISSVFGHSTEVPQSNFRLTFDHQNHSEGLSEQTGPFSSATESFVQAIPTLVRMLHYEWENPHDAEQLPAESYSALSITRALVAWAAIQSATRPHHEKKWLHATREITELEWKGGPKAIQTDRTGTKTCASDTDTPPIPRKTRSRPTSTYTIQSDIRLPDCGGELLTAEIGTPHQGNTHHSAGSHPSTQPGYIKLRHSLRRFSRMVLGGYGGAGIVFFGVNLPSSADRAILAEERVLPRERSNHLRRLDLESLRIGIGQPSQMEGLGTAYEDDNPDEECTLRHVLDDDLLDDDDGDDEWEVLEAPSPIDVQSCDGSVVGEPPYSWWNLLLGKHDKEIFEAFASHYPESASQSPIASMLNLPDPQAEGHTHYVGDIKPRSVTHTGKGDKLPRFWVLTDHQRQQIVLVLRGTMSLNEVAVDLACRATLFELCTSSRPQRDDEDRDASGDLNELPSSNTFYEYNVHEGMLALARSMGSPGKPVHDVVAKALEQNEGYDLILCGHSLGAGVCSVLSLLWADPSTCLTVPASGLPANRKLSVYAFAPPCVMSPDLSRAAASMVTSFVYSHDVVTRLSLGAIKDLQRVTRWLCYGQDRGHRTKESCSRIITRAVMLEKGISIGGLNLEKSEEKAWFLSLRKTLEANMTQADLYPPGRIIWAMHDDELLPENRRNVDATLSGLRLFEVEKVEQAFGEIMFKKDMIPSHFVQNYDKVLNGLL